MMNRIQFSLQNLFEGVLQLVYPPVCLVCGNVVEKTGGLRHVCRNCLQKLKPVPQSFIRSKILGRIHPCFLDDLYAGLEFDKAVQSIIHQIKYEKMVRFAVQFSRWCRSEKLAAVPSDFDRVIPIPLHPAKEKERGYNQSVFISRGLFDDSRIAGQDLIRRRHTRSQTALNRSERQKNVADAFRVTDPEIIRDKKIILVDDVVTTGATMNECARVLKTKGAARITGVTLATPYDF